MGWIETIPILVGLGWFRRFGVFTAYGDHRWFQLQPLEYIDILGHQSIWFYLEKNVPPNPLVNRNFNHFPAYSLLCYGYSIFSFRPIAWGG